MKQKVILLIVTFWLATIYSQTTFQKTYGGVDYEWAGATHQTNDGGYIIIGTSSSYGGGDEDFYLIKTDASGAASWTKTFSGVLPGPDYGNAGLQTNDGGYIITGNTMPFYGSDYNVCLIKTDTNGNLLWLQTYGGPDDDYSYSVKQTTDGGYITVGFTNSYGAGLYDIYLVKTDVNGGLLWTKTFGGASNDYGYSVCQTADGGYIVVGSTNGFGGPLSESVYLIKTNENGTLLWSKTFGGVSATVFSGSDILQTIDGGYLIGGLTYECSAGGTDILLIKTDLNGNVLWEKTYGGIYDELNCVVGQCIDGGYIVSGTSGNRDYYLIKTDTAGSIIWSKTYGGTPIDVTNNEYCSDVEQTIDSGYVLIGSSDNFSLAQYDNDIYLVKTDANGISDCNQTNYLTTEAFCFSPVNSPATISSSGGSMSTYSPLVSGGVNITNLCGAVSINDYNLEDKNISIFPATLHNGEFIYVKQKIENTLSYQIIDLNGKMVEYKALANNSIPINSLSAGMYIIQFAIENNIVYKDKFIVVE